MRSISSIAFNCFVVVLVLAALVTCGVLLWNAPRWDREEANRVYQSGARAKSAGASAQANPYIGVNLRWSRLWLEGWMSEGKE